jgi:hypothetical protein
VLVASCSGEGVMWERFLLAVRALRPARLKILLRGLLYALAWGIQFLMFLVSYLFRRSRPGCTAAWSFRQLASPSIARRLPLVRGTMVKREVSWTLDVALAAVRVLSSTHFLKASFLGLVILFG